MLNLVMAQPKKKGRNSTSFSPLSTSKNRSATLRVVPTGSTGLRNAETPWLTTYGAKRHAWFISSEKKRTAKRVPQHSIIKVAGVNVSWITEVLQHPLVVCSAATCVTHH